MLQEQTAVKQVGTWPLTKCNKYSSLTINFFIACLGERKACLRILANSLAAWNSASSFLAYDSLLMLSEDVVYIWRNRWKLGTVLYLLARYATPLYIATAIITSSMFLS